MDISSGVAALRISTPLTIWPGAALMTPEPAVVPPITKQAERRKITRMNKGGLGRKLDIMILTAFLLTVKKVAKGWEVLLAGPAS